MKMMASKRSTRYDYTDEYDDFFREAVSRVTQETAKPSEPKTSVEKDYIDLCFIDLKDTNSINTTLIQNDNVEATITIGVSRRNNTFSSYKTYYDEMYNKMNIIEDAIMKVKLKYPHCNVTMNVADTYIGLLFTL
jgi:hypothetical protein